MSLAKSIQRQWLKFSFSFYTAYLYDLRKSVHPCMVFLNCIIEKEIFLLFLESKDQICWILMQVFSLRMSLKHTSDILISFKVSGKLLDALGLEQMCKNELVWTSVEISKCFQWSVKRNYVEHLSNEIAEKLWGKSWFLKWNRDSLWKRSFSMLSKKNLFATVVYF